MDTEKMYQLYRPLLFSLAYRMLGSVMDAEDIIQEAFLTFDQLPPETNIRNDRAYLCKIVTNRCLNLLQSSAKQREVYVGTWLPEPLVEAENFNLNPSEIYQRKETISTAYLLLLQQLSAVERAVFILKEIFQYPYDEIGEIVGKSTLNCRQIFHRAKKSMHHKSPNHSTKSVTDSQVQLFLHALLEGDMESLMKLLTTDAVHYTDGGGKAQAVPYPVMGIENVIRFYREWTDWFKQPDSRFSYSMTDVNGRTGIVLTIDNRVAYVYSFEVRSDRIQSIYVVANPDKLKHVNPMLS
ncbi:RNA polymerase sigma factor SigJ [Paenibacillus rhizosphaerae]|uniref:RNA polymerase sigma factor SigJ n=1 Tax=Paenibacillus rhizosphaerae TaxID=297318 RepID=A0A1R1F445_9BACL|nr:RNA polymerase sigma-70 factor [Paenibacillus rhizosphaerae]OMF58879.1 RNA polymerase sigma factor SigJ [Paenibacillus rhizosphaerae]